jgi:hypothetical protein
MKLTIIISFAAVGSVVAGSSVLFHIPSASDNEVAYQ